MGLTFKIVSSERKVLDQVSCDRCNKQIEKISDGGWNQCGEPYSVFHEPGFGSFFHLKHNWGYNSRKDLETHDAVLCEDCYDVVFHDTKITVTHYM